MRRGWIRAVLLASLVTGAGILPGGVTVGSGPAGIDASCTAGIRGGAPTRSDGWMRGIGRGACTVTGDLGAPWGLEVTARLQRRQGDTWRTQAIAVTRVENGNATKRVDWLIVGAPCTASTVRSWRVRVVARATVSEKSVVVLDTATATSPVRTAGC